MNNQSLQTILYYLWPSHFSRQLDKTVAYLFCQTRNKIIFNLTNKSQNFLMLDLITTSIRTKLLTIVLEEFEVIILDIAEANLRTSDIYRLNSKILYDLVTKSSKTFIHRDLTISQKLDGEVYSRDLYLKSVLKDNRVLSANLIVYLLFGRSKIMNISFQYVEALLQNLIIRVSDLILHLILNKRNIYKTIYKTENLHSILYSKYWSMRSVEELQNNITYQNIKYFYIDQPRAIYSNRYQIVILSPEGILDKTIRVNRIYELSNLSYIQLIFPNLLEIQDFLVPKVRYVIFIIGKVVIYISFSIINNLLQFFLHTITRGFVQLAKT